MSGITIGVSPSSFAEIDKTPLLMLKNAGATVIDNPYGRRLTEDEALEFVKPLDGLIAGLEPLNKNVLSAASHLRAIARVGIGVENIDLDYAREKNILISNTPDGPTRAVAEMTLASLLTICRNIVVANIDMHRRKWTKVIGLGLSGLKIFIIGYGRIGEKTCELLTKVGAEIYVYDPYITKEKLKNGESYIGLYEGLKLADVISLHASGREQLLGVKEFGYMKRGCILLNSARGELVDETELVHALDKGVVSAAWFDVFSKEPYDGILTQYNNVILTPHIATYTAQCRLSMECEAVSNIINDLGIKRNE